MLTAGGILRLHYLHRVMLHSSRFPVLQNLGSMMLCQETKSNTSKNLAMQEGKEDVYKKGSQEDTCPGDSWATAKPG